MTFSGDGIGVRQSFLVAGFLASTEPEDFIAFAIFLVSLLVAGTGGPSKACAKHVAFSGECPNSLKRSMASFMAVLGGEGRS